MTAATETLLRELEEIIAWAPNDEQADARAKLHGLLAALEAARLTPWRTSKEIRGIALEDGE